MRKCIECQHYKVKLKCLECEQEADQNQPYITSQIINPFKSYVANLTDRQRLQLLCYVCHDISFRRLGILLRISPHTAKKIARIKRKIYGLF